MERNLTTQFILENTPDSEKPKDRKTPDCKDISRNKDVTMMKKQSHKKQNSKKLTEWVQRKPTKYPSEKKVREFLSIIHKN